MIFVKDAIPRGIVYHRVREDVAWLLKSLFASLNDIEKIKRFEGQFAAYTGRKHCIAFPSARIALYCSLKSLALPRGSEIIMPPITIKAILDVVLDLGLTPVFVDLDPETLCFDLNLLEKAVNENTGVALITYLFGLTPKVDSMVQMLKAHQVFVIEDFSQCLDGMYNGRKTGGCGDIGIYSASSIKTLDTYGGGLMVCDEDELQRIMRSAQSDLDPAKRFLLIKKIVTDLIRNLATTRFIFTWFTFPFIRFMSRIRPERMLKHTGHRNREMIKHLPKNWFAGYSSLQAEAGERFLIKVTDGNRIRIKNVNSIKKKASRTKFPNGVDGAHNVYWQLPAYFEKPFAAQRFLSKYGVDTSTTSLELISNLPAYPYQAATPAASRIFHSGLFIPAYPGLSAADIDRICKALNCYSEKNVQEN